MIAVNGAIDWLTRAEHFFTLDHSDENLRRLDNRRNGTRYHAAFPDHVPAPDGVKRYDRVQLRGDEPRPRRTPEWWLWRWSGVLGLSEDPARIHSGNSAYGALGLAYHLGYRRVALVGVDGTQEPKLDGRRPHNLSHLPLLFASALGQINVVSCGQLTGIPQSTLEQWYEDSSCRP